jgi:two-component system OmpR family response regulator
MRILVVEDDKKIASFVMKGLKEAGLAVDHAIDGEDGLHQALIRHTTRLLSILCCR